MGDGLLDGPLGLFDPRDLRLRLDAPQAGEEPAVRFDPNPPGPELVGVSYPEARRHGDGRALRAGLLQQLRGGCGEGAGAALQLFSERHEVQLVEGDELVRRRLLLRPPVLQRRDREVPPAGGAGEDHGVRREKAREVVGVRVVLRGSDYEQGPLCS